MNIKDLLLKLTETGEEPYCCVAKVISVYGMVCDVEPVNGNAPIHDVKLVADETNPLQWVVVPKQNSFVVVSFLSKEVAYVSLVGEPDFMRFANADIVFALTDKFLIKKGQENMYKIMTDLLDAIIGERHLTPYGPTISLTPTSQLKFNQLKTRVQNIFKDA